MKKLILVLLVSTLFFSCKERHKHSHSHYKKGDKYQKVVCYKHKQDNSDDFLFYYVILSTDGSNNYYYSSPTQVTNFSTVQFSDNTEIAFNSNEMVSETPVAQTEFSVETQSTLSENAEYFGGMTEEEMGNYETNEDTNTDNNSDSNSESSDSDSGSDSGSSSDGGGSSGGDGGGGGGD